ncbi:MAG TPA: hypothetical protein VJ644_09015 [Jiangellaceae bacterium]|nr:hypothetical protein [Jiangellaceae bacterium]
MLQDLISIAVAAAGVGLVALAIRQARSKGWAGSLQLAAGGLLLIGASAIGIVDFLAGIALSPLAWLGVIALGLAGVLFVAGQRLEGRKAGAGDGKAAEKRKQRGVEARPAAADDDMAEIEEILRRHGIQ